MISGPQLVLKFGDGVNVKKKFALINKSYVSLKPYGIYLFIGITPKMLNLNK